MADETLRFDVIGVDHASGAFSRVGGSVKEMSGKMDIAARQALVLDEALKRQNTAARASVDASLALAKADGLAAEAEHMLRDGALEAEFALKRETEAKKQSGRAAEEAAAKNKTMRDSMKGLSLSPGILGPALLAAPALAGIGGVGLGAAAGLGGAAVAGGAALAAFGAIAKPVLADTLAAQQKVNTAQNNYAVAIANGVKPATAWRAQQIAIGKAYAELSPQQIALSKQLGNMASAWQALKAAQTPVVAGALQPWLKSVTDLTGQLAPIIAKVSPVIKGLGTQFDSLINSAAFKGFRSFVANTGSKVVGAVGSTLIDFVKAAMILLPKFNPLILTMTGGIAGLGPALLKWANSKSTANHITAFMDWFRTNGPLVTGLLKNIGGALKTLAPGLGAASATELNVISGFFGMIAKLPPGLAKPLTEVAGTLLILKKMGVLDVGLKISAKAGGAFAETALGEALLGKVSGAKGLVVPVTLTIAALTGLSMIKDKKGGGSLLAPRASDLGFGGTWAHDISHWFDIVRHDVSAIWDLMWNNTIGRARRGSDDVFHWISNMRHSTANTFDGARHDVAAIWNTTWNNTIARGQRGLNDSDHYLGIWRHDTARWFDLARHDVASAWDATWNNTVSRAGRGVGDVSRWLGAMRRNAAGWLSAARSDAASIWNSIWNNTVGRTARGVGDTMRWVGSLPGRIYGAFNRAGQWLVGKGHDIIQGLWNGFVAVWGRVEGWFGGLPSKILHALGIHSPPPWSIDAGKHIMGGILKGLAHNASDVPGFFRGLASDMLGPLKGVWSTIAGLFGGGHATHGVSQWTGTVLRALSMLHLSPSLAGNVLYQMQTESGGNAAAINLSDINAQHGDPSRGLMQVIGATFSRFHVGGTSWNIYDPLANIAAAINYARSTYGPNLANSYGGIGSGHGYAAGTMSAAPGWGWVGEHGPELMHFRGGEQVIPAHSARSGGDIYLTVNAPVGSNPRDIGRQLANFLGAHIKGGGRIYPAGTAPR